MSDTNFLCTASGLPVTIETMHFIIHFGFRNPQNRGVGLGPGGIRNAVVLPTYVDSLERTYAVMTRSPWSRAAPVVGPSGKTHVYICDLSNVGNGKPFTAMDLYRVPFIALSCRNNEPTIEAELRRISAEAVHQAAHLFNFTERPYYKTSSVPWVWLDEGFANFIESVVLPGNLYYLRFLPDWLDQPHEPLDGPNSIYKVGFFVHYLAKKMGWGFVNHLWKKSRPEETPLETLERIMPPGQHFASAGPMHRDLFAFGYAMDSYFLLDSTCAFLPIETRSEYGDPTVAQGFFLRPGDTATAEGGLRHLAYRYYRIYPLRNVSHLRIEVTTDSQNITPALKAEVALVTPDRRRGWRGVLRPLSGLKGRQALSLSMELKRLGSEIDHLVLVITNCARSDVKITGKFGFADCLYSVKVSAT